MFALDQGRLTVAAGATGLIRACRDASASYARERKAFGVEIGQHQLVKEMIAQMESDYQASRLLWLRSAWLKNEGRRNTRETGLAKWFATVASERAASDAVQIHGANGYSDEYPVGRFYRNAKGAVIYEGTREIHKLMQADYVLGYRTDKPLRCELPPYPALTIRIGRDDSICASADAATRRSRARRQRAARRRRRRLSHRDVLRTRRRSALGGGGEEGLRAQAACRRISRCR